jgi:hypothetical protein
MIKKLLITAAAAAAMSVPLAGVALAETTADNPGVPGNLHGNSPGSFISGVALGGPGSIPAKIAQDGPPGGELSACCTPRQTP